MRRDETNPQAAPLARGGPLDALRFFAAFFMVTFHYSVDAPVALDTIHPVLGRGYLATDFFLMVSGYVLGRVYGERVMGGMGSGAFLLRRAGRFLPAHLMVAAGFAALVLVAGRVGIAPTNPKWFDWAQLPQQVFLVQSWGVFGGGLGWNAPTWSLSALLVCYFAFPPLWRALRRLRSPALVLAMGIGGLALADLVARAVLGQSVFSLPMHYGVIRAAPLFFLGLTLAVVAETAAIPQKVAIVLGSSAVALLALVQAVGRFDFVSLALIALIVLSAGAVHVKTPSRLLERGALISFSLFITNELVRVGYFGVGHALAGKLGLGLAAQWAIWFAAPVAAVAVAALFHDRFDQPVQAWIKRRRGSGLGLKARLAAVLPHPDPSFDPFTAEADRAPRVREILLHSGPLPGGFYGREQLEGSAGLAWG